MSILEISAFDSRAPAIERVRHEPRRRMLSVKSSDYVTPSMLRLTLAGDSLDDFRSVGFDDTSKIFVKCGSQGRDYTPRRFDPIARTLTIDFAVHEGGAVTNWARAAIAGDKVTIGGPKGSAVISPDVRRWLLIGDETAMPAIGRLIEEAVAGVEITSVVAVADMMERQDWQTRAKLTTHWVHRPLADAADPSGLLAVIREVSVEPETFVWITAEAGVARSLRDYVLEERCHPRGWLKAGGYWVAGRAGGKSVLADGRVA